MHERHERTKKPKFPMIATVLIPLTSGMIGLSPSVHAKSADVVALEDSQLLVLSWGRIDRLTRRFPILAFRLFRNLTRIIGARLRQTSEYKVENRVGAAGK